MPCHQHRCCCRRAANSSAPAGEMAADYVLLAATDGSALDGAIPVLRSAGAWAEPHDLGLRINCRGTGWQAALGRLSETLSPPTRRRLRVAQIPIGADTRAFHDALLASQPLEVFLSTQYAAAATCAPADSALLGDVFKGESLE